jgi:hypothetical protein
MIRIFSMSVRFGIRLRVPLASGYFQPETRCSFIMSVKRWNR